MALMVYPPHPYAEAEKPEIPDFVRPDSHRFLQLIAGIAAFVVAQLASVGVMTIVDPLSSQRGPSNPIPPYAYGLGLLVGGAVMLVLYMLIMRFIAGAPGHGLRGKSRVTEVLLGIMVSTGILTLSVIIIAVFGGFRITGLTPRSELLPALIVALGTAVGPAFMEELLFRGFFLRILDAWLGWIPALAITSALFGAAHLANPDATFSGAVFIAIEAGLLLGGAYLLTRRLWLAIGLHAAWNFVQAFVFSSSVSGTGESTGIFDVEWSGSTWLTGGAMGLEGSAVTALLGLIAGIGPLRLAAEHGALVPREAAVRRKREAEEARETALSRSAG